MPWISRVETCVPSKTSLPRIPKTRSLAIEHDCPEFREKHKATLPTWIPTTRTEDQSFRRHWNSKTQNPQDSSAQAS